MAAIMERPYTLIAELTYRCPLSCAYCSNPTEYAAKSALETTMWRRIIRDAEDLGVLQVNFTGGEPLLRDDLDTLVAEASSLSLYANLITAGMPLTRERLAHLRDCGLDSMQLSIQSPTRELCDNMAGMPVYEQKLAVAKWAWELDLPLTLNIVLHGGNIAQIHEIIRLAERLSAQRLELANTQYLGWALKNRTALLPTRGQLEEARAIAAEARQRLKGSMEIIFVMPDYYTDVPRACMDGWGRRYLIVTPDGLVLPCHAAHTITSLPLERVTDRSLRAIWETSTLFNSFRGESWMPSTCRNCERRGIDFGGCRCQAFHLTGNAAAVDPACRFSAQHAVVEQARREVETTCGKPTLMPRILKKVP